MTYTADHYNGYVADVKYDGQAVYPKYEPKPYAPPHPAPHKPAPYHPPPPPPPAYKPVPHPAPSYKPSPYEEVPRPYSYEYGVADEYSGTNFNAHEQADGKAVSGSYQVHLPDGRIQVRLVDPITPAKSMFYCSYPERCQSVRTQLTSSFQNPLLFPI